MLTTSLKMIPRTLRSVQPVARASIMPVMRAQAMRTPIATPSLSRSYASGGGLSKDEIKTRVEDVLKSFEKVDPSKVNAEASFTGDLGLDSLDAVEVVMAIEEEFNIEIPDTEADNITTVQQAISYIEHTPDAV
ncbi:mitochondrial acyl carrier protein [Malassezia psittaci]|uniref:Acyl carrier protein n=1 Tax=Malassezia psittaci TaxID=1821823 RepID=A0AAF0F785_9BASI|nr:mitochondrial acyl carrier protein [Malassezia psittaci]